MKRERILSVYFTAGYPGLNDTAAICRALAKGGADLIEVGIPFSDPVADGEVIQASSQAALENGMTLKILFEQLEEARKNCELPLILMGYLNPILQYGIEKFCERCRELSVYGAIIPDLPYDLYIAKYREIFEANNLCNIFLITPQTSEQRIREIDRHSTGFIYAVSSAAVTGGKVTFASRVDYLERLKALKLKNPILVGFGVSTSEDFNEICKHVNGAIIGSAYIRELREKCAKGRTIEEVTTKFLKAFA